MELAQSFQGLVVVFIVVSSSVGALDCVHLVIVVPRSLASEVIVVVTTPIPSVSMVAVIAAPRVLVVEMFAAVVLSRRQLDSSDVFSNELFCVIGVSVIFGEVVLKLKIRPSGVAVTIKDVPSRSCVVAQVGRREPENFGVGARAVWCEIESTRSETSRSLWLA